MPYADPEKQKEAAARWFRQKYATDKEFRADEAARKKVWLNTDAGRMSNAVASERAFDKAKRKKAAALERAAQPLVDNAYQRGLKARRRKDAKIIADLKAQLEAAKAALKRKR